MKNVVANRALLASEFLKIMTGEKHILEGDEIDFIHNTLADYEIESDDFPLWDYPLNEIDEIVANDKTVVLVQVMTKNEDGSLSSELRWFEIPKNCADLFKEVNPRIIYTEETLPDKFYFHKLIDSDGRVFEAQKIKDGYRVCFGTHYWGYSTEEVLRYLNGRIWGMTVDVGTITEKAETNEG